MNFHSADHETAVAAAAAAGARAAGMAGRVPCPKCASSRHSVCEPAGCGCRYCYTHPKHADKKPDVMVTGRADRG